MEDIIIEELPDYFFPLLVQQYIPKELEIRSFYLGGVFYNAAIISQNDKKTICDFRNYNYEIPNRIIPVELPVLLEQKLSNLMKILNMDTGSIDIIFYKNEYYFLEINPVGQFDMISYPCNYQLDRHIAKFLITKDEEYKKK